MQQNKPIYQRHQVLSLVLFLFVSIAILDLLAGLWFIPSGTNNFRCKHPYYHHGLKANRAATTSWNGTDYYSFYTNSLGFRDEKVRDVPLSTSKRRILLMGDSYVESVGVEYERSFPGILQSQFDTLDTEILNAAVVGYSPKLYFLKLKYLIEKTGLKFDELIVFIDISDIQNELLYKDFNPDERKINETVDGENNFINRYPSYIVYAFQKISQDRKRKEFYKKRGKDAENPRTDLYYTFFDEFRDDELLQNEYFHTIGNWYLDKALFDKWGREGLTLEKWYMLQIVNLCKKHKIKMSVSVHPWPVQIKTGDWNSIQVQFWKKFATDNGLQFINFFSVLEKEATHTNVIKKYYFNGDVHLNEEGHKLFARELFGLLSGS